MYRLEKYQSHLIQMIYVLMAGNLRSLALAPLPATSLIHPILELALNEHLGIELQLLRQL